MTPPSTCDAIHALVTSFEPVVAVAGHIDVETPTPAFSINDTNAPTTQSYMGNRPKRLRGCQGLYRPKTPYRIKSATGRELLLPEFKAVPSVGEFEGWIRALGNARRQCRPDGKLPKIICLLEGCPREFTKISELKAHLSFKLKIRAYKCNSCSMDFCNQGNLDRHRKQHCQNRVVITADA